MQGFVQLLPLIVVFVVFYAFLIIPERKRKKKYDEMLNNLKVNDEILTKGGIIGKIINLKDDYIILESGPDKSRLKISKHGIANALNKKEENK
ncbi:hypothetical protein CPJCM30710_13000 [Clostridium polyendosporum]|uniref:Preprotein translocase subunit YajC n=1 Tax=Clostridium polyendosporum TaxID=69208 RepID=A0A919VE14_9CLOT|nr:preprotein translocase subunit YajC [Clostridium polyendosporum]GIM28634.1 hypothetical protein CPJCM30710_13000 [Clostridium polyendosporum]